MKTIGTWISADEMPDNRENYPIRTAQDLEIADLKRENNAAFERIQELSEALFNLGYDPRRRRVSKSREHRGYCPQYSHLS